MANALVFRRIPLCIGPSVPLHTPKTLMKTRFRLRRKNIRRLTHGVKTAICGILSLGMFFTGPVSAIDLYWDSDGDANGTLGGSGVWNLSNLFWDPFGTDPLSGSTNVAWSTGAFDTAVFGDMAGTVTLGSNVQSGGLRFDTSGYTIVPSGTETLTLAAAPGKTSPIIAVNSLTPGGNTATIAAILAGTSGFTKTGNGTLTLTNNGNTFSGDLSIKQGQLVITHPGQLGTGTTAISVTGIAQTGNPGYSGGSLVLQGSSASAGATGITLNREVSISGRGPGQVNNTGGLVSIGYNTLASDLTFGSAAGENRVWATHGTTSVTGGVNIAGTGQGNIFQGNGNWYIGGVVTGSDFGNDRFIKTGQVIATTLWLQNSNNNFAQAVRADSGTVRVQANGALGINNGTGQIDLNSGAIEFRTDAAAGFANRTVRIRNNTTGTFFFDHDITGELGIGSSLQNQTVTLGALTRDAGANVTNWTFNGRNGYNISLTSTAPVAADYRGITLTNNSSGTVTINGDVWNANNATASTFTVQGNGDSEITGSILATNAANVLTKGGTGTFTYRGTAGSYSGVTNINAGTLSFSNVGGFAGTSGINLASAALGGALNYIGAGETLAKTINLNSTTGPAFIQANQVRATNPFVISSNFTATGAGAKTLVLGGGNQLANEISGVIVENSGTNSTSVTKTGSGNWTLSGANTNTGALTVNAGTLTLKATAAGAVDIYKATGAVIFNADATTALSGHLGSQTAGGVLQFDGFTGGSQEALGALTPTAGHGRVVIGGTTTGSTLTFASLGTRTAGATLNLAPGGTSSIIFSAAPGGTNGIVGGYATYGANGTDFLAAGGTASAYTGATTLVSGSNSATTNFQLDSGSVALGTSNASFNSLKLSGSALGTDVTLNGIATVTTGGILFDNTLGSASISGGTQLGAANSEVIVTTNGAGAATDVLTIGSAISSGTGQLTKAGTGTLVLSGASAFTGNVHINEGTVQMSGATARIGTSQAAGTVFNLRQGATFDLNGAGASGTIVIGALNGAGTITNSGGGSNTTSTLVIGNGATTTATSAFTGVLQDGSGPSVLNVTKDGTGTQYLTGQNSYTGVTTITRGTLAVTSLANGGLNSGIGASSNAAGNLVFNGGVLQYTGSNATVAMATQSPSTSTDRQFTLAGNGTIQSSGTYGNSFLATGAANSASLIFSNTSDLAFSGAGTRTLTLGGTSIGDNEMRIRLRDNPSAAIDYLSLTKADGGLWILNPTSSNTYGGTTTVSGGALRVAGSGATVQGLSASSPLVLNGGVLETSGTFTRTLGAPVAGTGGTVQLPAGSSGFAAATPDRLVVTLGGGALAWGSTNFAPSALVLGSSTALGETEITNDINFGGTARTITVNNNSNTGTMVTAGILSGVLSGNAGIGFTKGGGGVLILGDANTYTGNTNVTGGNLIVTSIHNGGASSSLGLGAGALVYNPGDSDLNALFYVGDGEIATRNLTLTSSAQHSANRVYRMDSSGSGALVWNGGTFTNTVTGSAAGRTLTLELRGSNTDNNQMNLVLTNSTGTNTPLLGVTKSDGGVWTLNPASANTFTGPITLSGGNLGLTTNGIGSASSITFNNGSVFGYGGALTTSVPLIQNNNTTAVVTGSNNVTFNGSWTVLTGNNAQTISNNLENGAVLTVNGPMINQKANDQTINIRGFGSTVWNGVIPNAAANTTAWNIAIANDATFTFGGSSANTYTGITTLSQGTLILNKTLGLAQIGNGTSQFNFGGGVVQSNAGALTGANALNNPTFLTGDPVTFQGTNSIQLAGALTNNAGNRNILNSLTGGATLTLSGPVYLSESATTGRTLTVRGTGNTTISGVVSNFNGSGVAGGLAYSGSSGSLTLTGNNTATGALTVNRNSITLSGSGDWDGSIALFPTGTITLDNSAGTVNRLADAGAVNGSGGILNFIGNNAGGSSETTGALTLNSVQTYITMNTPTSGTNTLTFASANFANTGSSLNLSGVPSLGTTNKVKFTTFTGSANAAVTSGNIMPRVFIGGTDFATYDSTDGVKAFSSYDNTNSLAQIAPVAATTTGSRTNASAVVTLPSTAGISAFMSITGAGIPAGTYVVSVDSATQLTLSQNATSTSAGAADFIVNEAHVMNLTANTNLAGNATRDAIKINGSGLTIGGAALNRLTLNAGAILNTGGNNSLNTPEVSFGSNVGYVQVQSGTTLTVGGSLIGFSGWSKALPGNLQINSPTFVSSTTNLLNGTTRLNGGLNTLFPNQTLNINEGATLDLFGNTQYVGQLSDPGTMPGAGGEITTTGGNSTFVTNMSAGSTLFSGVISGSNTNVLTLGRVGGNTLTFNSAQTYYGATYLLGGTTALESDATILNSSSIDINGATLQLNNNNALQYQNNNRIGDAIPITLRDGTISVTGRISTAATESLGTVTSDQGSNTITATATAGTIYSMDLSIANLVRNAGTTVNFTGTNLGQQGNNARITFGSDLPTILDGALGPWAIANSTDFAAYNSGNGVGVVGQGGFTGYSGSFGAGLITEIPAVVPSTTMIPAGTTTTGMLKIAGNTTNNIAFANGTATLNLAEGGLLRSSNVFDTTIGTTTTRGVLTAGGTEASGLRELIVFNNATGNPTFTNPNTAGGIVAGSPVVIMNSTVGIRVGMTLTNGNFPAGTTVVSVDSPTQMTLSNNATTSAQNQTFTGGAYLSGATTANSAVVTMNSTVGLAPGMTFTGTNVPAGTYIVSVDSATQVTLSQNATTTGTGITFTGGVSNTIINSVIADNGFGNSVKFIKSGAGVVNLSANNTYTGGTSIIGGTVNLTGSGVVIPAGGILLGGANLTMNTNAGQIDPTNDVTIRRSSVLTLTGNNVLSSLAFENNGGSSNPTVTTGGVLTLTAATPITVSSNVPMTVPTINGSINFGSGARTIDTPTVQIGGVTVSVSEQVSTLNIAAGILSPGVSITKTGLGNLQLGGQSTFNGLTVSAGGITLGGSSTQSTNVIQSGPLGLGNVSMASGTRFIAGASAAVNNPISFAATPTFDNIDNTARTLTLNGALTGAGINSGTPTIDIKNPFLTVSLLGTLPAMSGITKTGPGILIFNATNYTGNFDASALGNPNAISLIHDGDGTGLAETISMGSVAFDPGIIPNITVNRGGGTMPFPAAANKILAPSSISNLNLGLLVTNSNGYGLEASGAIAFNGTSNYSVSTATASNVTQGLYLTGDLTGNGFSKIGAGTVVINNATPADNTFTGNINVNQGVVSVNSDAQLGNSANQIKLSPTTGTSTFRATGTFATSRTIDLAASANTRAIEVTEGNTLTLNSAFGLTGGASTALVKADLGTLVLGASNAGWTGGLTINGGAVVPNAANTLPSGTITINETSAALQLNGLAIANAITIDVPATTTSLTTRNLTGLNTQGAIQAFSGTNSLSSTVTVNGGGSGDNQSRNYGFGANSGATLNLTNVNYNLASTGTNRNLIGYYNTLGTGVINVSGVIDNTNGSPGANSFLFKIGDGSMNLSAANAIPDTEVRIYRGAMTLNGAATFGTGATQVQVWQNGSLTFDNSVTNTGSRFSNRVVQAGGGTLNFIPNASGSTHTSTGALQISQGASTINLAAGGSQTVTFASLTQNAGSTLNVTGTFGTASNKLTFTTAPTLVPASTGILARILTNGTEFASYNATNGIVPFAGYAAVTNILSASATQSFNATDTTANSLTGNQTLNALKLTSGAGSTNVGGLSGLNPTTLTLTSGGVLVNGTGSGSTLSVPVVAFGGTEAIFHVLSGQTLDVTSGMSGTAGLTKSSNGSMTLNQQQFISGNTIVNAGTLSLQPGATNTLLFNNGLGVNGGATVDLKNGVQFIGSLFSANGGTNTDLGGGTVTNTGAQATLVTNSNSNFNGQINGTIYLNKTGVNSLNLQGVNGYSGPTFVTGGTLSLNDDGSILNTTAIDLNFGTLTINNGGLRDKTNRVSDTAPITMRGGTLNFAGRGQANSSETVGAVTLGEGHNSIFADDGNQGIGSGILTIASLARSPGSTATLRFNNVGDFGAIGTRGRIMVTAEPTLTNNIIGPWAVIDRELASYDTTFGIGALNQTGFAGYSATPLTANPTSSDNVRFGLAGTTTLPTNTTVGTLTFGQQTTATTLNLGGNTLTIAGGALLFGQGTDNVNFAITNGSIAGPAGGGDLYIHHLNYTGTNRTASIDAAITDNGGAVRVIKTSGDTGASVMTWNGTNTYTGGTVLNTGTLTLGASSTLGTGGITVYQATLNQTAGAIIPSQMLTMNGPGTVNLAGNNTLTGLAFNNLGGTSPTVNPTGVLTLTGGITSTSVNAGAISTIGTGTLDLNGAGAYSINVGAVTVNSQSVAPWQGDLLINSVIQNGGIVKSGTGNLQLAGQSTFAGGLTVNAGGLVLGASSTPNGIGETVLSGPVGTGTLTMADGTSMAATTAVSIANDVVFGDDGFGTGTHVFNGTNNITLNGLTTLPSIWNATITAPQTTITIADASGSLSGDVINKSGLGLLVMGAYNGTVQATGGLVFSADGNGLGTQQNLSLGGNLVITGDTAITVNRSGAAPNSRNKLLQKVDLTVPGNIMSVSNQSGYGLEFTGNTTLTGPAHFAVGVATPSDLVQGLVLSGTVDDGASSFGITKSGLGTLVLNGTNFFGGAGQTIDILNGVVSANSDVALGDAANTITLNVDGSTGVGFRATSSFGSSRTFVLNQANNAFEVTGGSTFTLNTPFSVTTATNALHKNDSGIFAINASNTGWTGAVTINGGAIQVQNNTALGSGAITLNGAIGTSLQLSGGVTLANAITNNGNSQTGGITSGGHISSVSGVNTVTGLITQGSGVATTYGAENGATLNINGNIATANTAAFYTTGTGVINLNSLLGNGGVGGALTKFGPGTLNVTANHTAYTGTVTVSAGTLTISGAGVKFGITGAVTVNPTGTVFVDDTGTATANRLGGRPVTLVGGTLSYKGNGTTSTETAGALTANRPGSTIVADSNGGTSTLTFASLTQGTDGTLNFVSAGAALGSASNKIVFTTAPTLTNSVLQRATLNGSDFVTYGANGIAAFTTYNAGSTTNLNSVTATTGTADVNAVMTTRALTASRTFNAIRLSDPAGSNISATGTAFVAGGTTPAQLALTAGAILATGGGSHTLSVPVLNNAAVLSFYSVNTGTSLEITSAIVGTGGWVKNGPGTLTFTPPSSPITGRGASTISGNAVINDGTVVLNGGNNTLAATNFLILGPTGTLDLNGNSQVGRLMTDAAVENGGGIVTGSTASSTLVATYTDDRNWAGQLTGAMSFVRTGSNTLTAYSNNTYTGKTLVAGGALTLTDGGRLSGTSELEIAYATLNLTNSTGTKDVADRINDSAPISMRGGTINYTGRPQTASTETLGAVTLNKGYNTITSAGGGTGVNSATLTLAGLSQTAGSYATVNFNSANLGQLGSFGRVVINNLNGTPTDATTVGLGLTNNIIGPWAIAQNDFATYIPGLGIAALGANGALQYDRINTFNGSMVTDNIRLTTTSTIPSGGKTINALSMSGSNIALNFTSGNDVLNLVSGGLIGPNNNQTIGTTAIRGVLTAGGTNAGTNPLYLYNRANTLTVNSQIVDNGTGITKLVLTASGGAITLGNGTNSYTGGTVVNGGTVTLSPTVGTVVIPAAATPADGLVINGATVNATAAGQIDPSNIVTINGSTTLNLVGNNTLAGLVFRNDGGGTTASAVSSTSGLLTLNGNIVSSATNLATTSILNGRVDFGSTQRTLDISATRFNGQELGALLSDFNLQGIVGSTGGFEKTGDGVLQFNAAAIYTGDTIVSEGRIQIGLANGGSRFSTYDLGAGTALNLNNFSTVLGGLSGTGFVMNSGTSAQTLSVGYNGDSTTFSGNFYRFNDAVPNGIALAKVGAGTLTFDTSGAASNTTGALTINRGAVTYKDAGTSHFENTATIVNEGGTLNIDNSTGNSSQGLTNRLANGAVTLNGGTINLLGRDSAATAETSTGALTLGPSASLINLTAGASGTANLTFGSFAFQAGSTGIVSGTNLGTDTKLLFTTAPTLTSSILPRVAVGTDFATYNATNGVIAFSAYTVPTDINAATSTQTIEVTSATTTRDITLGRTVNAIKITDNNVTLGSNGALLPTQGLTVGSGGIIVNGNGASITAPVLALGAEGIFRVNGTSLDIASSMTGTSGFTKTGSGSLTLSSAQSYTGQTALNLGNLTLAGGKNTILVAPTLTASVSNLQVNGGLFDINGNDQAVGTLLNSNILSFIAGEITNSSGTAATLTSVMGASSTFGAKITGNLNFVRSGNNTLTLPDAHTYTGATIVRGGGLTLQDMGALNGTSSITLNFGTLTLNNSNLNQLAALNPVRFAANTPLNMQGAAWVITPGGSADNTTTVNTVTIASGGANTITANGVAGGTNTINIGNLILPANSGTTLHFNTDPGQPTTSGAQVFLGQINGVTPTNNSFLGANVVLNNGEYGVYNTLQGVIRLGGTAITGNTVPAYAAALASGNNLPTNISSTGADVAIGANTTIGALRLTGAATRNITFTAGTEVLNLALGGLLRDNNANATNIGTSALRGVLTSGGTASTGTTELVIYNNQNTITINSVIANNGLGNLTRYVKSGAGTQTLTAQNTYSGGTVVNQGTLNLTGTTAGFVVIPAGGLTINNATVTMNTNAGQIAASNDITINGSGVMTFTGTNTVNSVTFNNPGGNATPTVAAGTSLTLSAANAITATNDNFSFTPTISGTALVLSDANPVITVNAGQSPSGLIISAPLNTTGGGTIAKNGGGSLILGGTTAHVLTGGLNINAGSVAFDNTAGTNPYGTGTISLADGVAIRGGTAARTVANPIAVAGNFTFGTLAADNATANASNALTLSGTVTLAAGAHSIAVNGLLMSGTISGKLTGGTNLTKEGLGTLVLSNATNDFGGSTTVNGGILQLGAAGVIPDASALIINGGGFINLNGFSETVGSLAGSGVVTNTGAAQTITVGTDNTDTDFSGVITNQANALSLTKTGTGTQTLSGTTNSYTGATTISGGTLVVGKLADGGVTSSIGSSTNAATNLVIGGGTLKYVGSGDSTNRQMTLGAAGGTIESSGTGAVNFSSTSALALSGTDTARTLTLRGTNTGANILAAVIADNGTGTTSVTKQDAGRWVLTGSSTYTGTTTISGGKLQLGNGGTTGSLNSASSLVNNATLSFNRSDVITQGSEFNSVISGTGEVHQEGTGTVVLNGTNTYEGATRIKAGKVSVSTDANLGTAPVTFTPAQLELDGGTLLATATFTINDNRGIGVTVNGGAFEVTAGETLTIGGGSAIALNGALAKTGEGALIVDATTTGTGTVTVSAGTLGGTGTISGATTVQGGAALAGGTIGGLGTLTFSGDLTADSGSTWLIDLVQDVDGSSDRITVLGDLELNNATLSLATTGAYMMDNVYTIASYSSLSGTGTFNGLSEGAIISGYQINYGTVTAGAITLTAVPEPGTLGLLGLALGGFLFRRNRRKRSASIGAGEASETSGE